MGPKKVNTNTMPIATAVSIPSENSPFMTRSLLLLDYGNLTVLM